MKISGKLRITAWDRDGRVTQVVEVEMRSPVKALLNMIALRLTGDTTNNLRITPDTGNTSRTMVFAATSAMMDADGDAADAAHGIVIGTDATAPTISDYALAAQIAEGAAAGQMNHEAQTNPADVTTSDPTVTIVLTRNFNNNSGGSITIKETGIYAKQTCTGPTDRSFCIVRDTPTEVAVADGGGATVEYTITMSE